MLPCGMNLLALTDGSRKSTGRCDVTIEYLDQRVQGSLGEVVCADVCPYAWVQGEVIWGADGYDNQWLFFPFTSCRKLYVAYHGDMLGEALLVNIPIRVSRYHYHGTCSVDEIFVHWPNAVGGV